MRALIRASLVVVAPAVLAVAAIAQTPPPALGTCGGQAPTFGNVRLPQTVLANGKPVPAGVYEVRITTERPAPAVGQSAAGECWVEFLKDGSVVGREVASVIGPADIASVAKGAAPKPNTARVDELKGGEHVRVWINDAGTHYLINLSVAPSR
jgi:hypothetical protein